ncbi:MAG: 16S rRNA (adenine(1518)-N(6)/adenine(1519)-N(6))-dimethyltransferase RsmA [Succinivibrionaceae bacterium]|nr:16S rRNA (adenine(1518)-N(6)/adenine(1519)-N(6))-dimethyltransferase RsmA [Succinivibrionaceae bacterium]
MGRSNRKDNPQRPPVYHAKKQFGQNFLRDEGIIAAIVDAIAPGDDATMVEIGPGLGALTEPVCDRISHLNVIEIDRDLAEKLRHHPFIREKLTIYETDALTFDFASLKTGKPLRIYGNLPYNISTPLLFHLLSFREQIADMHFMLQKEVVDRLTAAPGSKDYGRLTVMGQYAARMMPFLAVPPEAFVPSPKVDSAVIRIVPHQELPYPAEDEKLLNRIVTAAFSQRRKTIANSLSEFLQAGDFARLAIDAALRAENLSVEQYVRICNHVRQRDGS